MIFVRKLFKLIDFGVAGAARATGRIWYQKPLYDNAICRKESPYPLRSPTPHVYGTIVPYTWGVVEWKVAIDKIYRQDVKKCEKVKPLEIRKG